MRRSVETAAVLCVACMVLGGWAAQAARAHVSWRLASTTNAGAPTRFTWKAKGVGRSKLVVQKQEGTARAWRTIVRLAGGNSGSAELPPLALGSYALRIAAIGSRASVLASQSRVLHVFGQVNLEMLFAGYPGFYDGRNGTYATPTRTFSYVIGFPEYGSFPSTGEPPMSVDSISKANNHCRSIHLEFVPGSASSKPPPPGYIGVMTIVQETLDPVSVSVPANSIGSLDATLVPGHSWTIKVSHTGTTESGDPPYYSSGAFYVNGYGFCDSASSLFH
jgi:hypothetical protein